MNEFLAELYGTRDAIGTEDSSDVEKLAEAQILDDVLQSEGIDVDQLDDGTILKLAHEIFGDDSELVKSAMAEGDESESEEAEEESSEEKTAEADMLGRVMAHSMVQELGQIEMEKEAKGRIGRELARLGKKGKGAWEATGGALGRKGKSMKGSFAKGKKDPGKTTTSTRSGGSITDEAGVKGGLKRMGAEHKKTVGGVAAALGVGGAAGAGYAMGKKKKDSAIDKLAEQRAVEILAENGIELQQEEPSKLASAIEQRAWELLAENGYVQE